MCNLYWYCSCVPHGSFVSAYCQGPLGENGKHLCSGDYTSNDSGGNLLQVSTYAESCVACLAKMLVLIQYCCCSIHHATSTSTPYHHLLSLAELSIMKSPTCGSSWPCMLLLCSCRYLTLIIHPACDTTPAACKMSGCCHTPSSAEQLLCRRLMCNLRQR